MSTFEDMADAISGRKTERERIERLERIIVAVTSSSGVWIRPAEDALVDEIRSEHMSRASYAPIEEAK